MAMTVALNTFTRCNMFGNLSRLSLDFAMLPPVSGLGRSC